VVDNVVTGVAPIVIDIFSMTPIEFVAVTFQLILEMNPGPIPAAVSSEALNRYCIRLPSYRSCNGEG